MIYLKPNPLMRVIMLKLKSLLVGVALCALTLLPSTGIAENNIANQIGFTSITNEGLINYYAIKYGADAKQVKRVGICESKLSMNPPGHNDGGLANGAWQYHVPTWEWLTGLMGEPDLNIKSFHDQAKVTSWAFAHGYAYLWTCK